MEDLQILLFLGVKLRVHEAQESFNAWLRICIPYSIGNYRLLSMLADKLDYK